MKPGQGVRSKLDAIAEEWAECTRCPLGVAARHHVLWEFGLVTGQGVVRTGPGCVSLMLLGEGPGVSENELGRPFIGVSGQLLREVLVEALPEGTVVGLCFTNLLACRPYKFSPSQSANRAPSPHEVELCLPRVQAVHNAIQPSLLVALGRVPGEYTRSLVRNCKTLRLYHPAFIARGSGTDRQEYVKAWQEVYSDLGY